MMDSSSIHIMIGCVITGTHSTLEGDIIRTILVDDDTPRNRMAFDWSLAAVADNGPANRNWVHMVLSVTHTITQVFVDGMPAASYGFGVDDPTDVNPTTMHLNSWMTTNENLAFESAAGRMSE